MIVLFVSFILKNPTNNVVLIYYSVFVWYQHDVNFIFQLKLQIVVFLQGEGFQWMKHRNGMQSVYQGEFT